MQPFSADNITLTNFEGFFKYKKRPLVVHAIQLNFPEGFEVTTIEGKSKGESGDYLIFGIEGEKYPCAKRIFEASYIKCET